MEGTEAVTQNLLLTWLHALHRRYCSEWNLAGQRQTIAGQPGNGWQTAASSKLGKLELSLGRQGSEFLYVTGLGLAIDEHRGITGTDITGRVRSAGFKTRVMFIGQYILGFSFRDLTVRGFHALQCFALFINGTCQEAVARGGAGLNPATHRAGSQVPSLGWAGRCRHAIPDNCIME